MGKAIRRAVRFGAGAALMVTGLAVAPDAASARCNGTTRVTNTFISGGQAVTRDTPRSGTCDGDTEYRFDMLDGPFQDNRCSYIQFHSAESRNPLLSRYTCGSVDNTYYDDTNSTYGFRFQTSGVGGKYSVFNTGTGH